MFRAGLFLHPPRSYLSARSVNSRKAKEKELQRNQPLRKKRIQTSYAWRHRSATTPQMWGSRGPSAYAEKQRGGAACVGRWAAASAEMTAGISVSKKRSVKKQMKSCLGHLMWREDGVPEKSGAISHHLLYASWKMLWVIISGWAEKIWRWMKRSSGIDAQNDFDQ